MNTVIKQERIFQQVEQALKVIAAVLIAATPVYALWAISTVQVTPLA